MTDSFICGRALSVGVFGGNSGTISNLGLVGGSIIDTDVSGNAGSLVAYNTGTVANSYATTTVTGDNVGGLVGLNDLGGKIISSYATGAVTGGTAAGGLVGQNNGTISNSYSIGSVSSGGDAGGLVGLLSSGTVTTSFATGAVAGGPATGGLIGENRALTSFATDYWDTATSGTGTGIGLDLAPATAPPNGVTTSGTTGLASASVLSVLNGGGTVWGNVNNQTTPYLLTNPGPVYLGSDSSPIPPAYTLVFNTTQLQAINNGPAGNYALAQNIDAIGYGGFTPIGSCGCTPFSGKFNGLGHVIADLTIDSSSGLTGLFGQTDSATISNIGLIGGSVTDNSIGAIVGGLVGFATSTTISNVYYSGTVTGGGNLGTVGGLVGLNNGGTIQNAYTTGSVTGPANAGGFVATYVGGLVGNNEGTTQYSYSTAAVTGGGSRFVGGGLIGLDLGGTTQFTYAAGVVSASGGGGGGGLIGSEQGSLTGSYWVSDRSGAVSGGATQALGPLSSSGGVTTLTAASGPSPFNHNSYSAFTFPGIAGATNTWVIVDQGGTINNSDGATGATMPMLASEYQTTIQNAHQLQLMAMSRNSNYTLGRDIDATATGSGTSRTTGTDVWGCAAASCASSFTPIGFNGSNAYTGTFDGGGHTISTLTINTSVIPDAGLFGAVGSGGAVQNVGLIGGSVTDTAALAVVGALVGANSGTISNAYATAAVSGPAGGLAVGGLVGTNNGSITQSYAAGAVTSHDGPVGGLVGQNFGAILQSFAAGAVTSTVNGRAGGLVGLNNSGGVITDAYAVGPVAANNGGSAAGLVASNIGSITDAYATGAVTGGGGARLAGLVVVNSGTVTKGYFDSGTTGPPDNGIGTAMTTAQLQGTSGVAGAFNLATDFVNPGNWNIINGKSYPYLCWQFGGCGITPQVVSGTVYQDLAASSNAGPGIPVPGLVNGIQFNSAQTLGTVTTAANGYYYYLLAPNTIPVNNDVLLYAKNYSTGSGTTSGAVLEMLFNGSSAGADILGSTLNVPTGATTFSAISSSLNAAITATNTLGLGLTNTRIAASGAFTVDVPVTATTNLNLTTAGDLALNAAITASGKTVTLNSSGGITQTPGITAASLRIISVLSVDMADANQIGTLAASVTGAGSTFAFRNDATSLSIGTVDGTAGVTTNNGNIVLETTTSGDITINAPVNANNGSTTLGAAPGMIGISSAGAITVNDGSGQLIGSAVELLAADTVTANNIVATTNSIGANPSGGAQAGTIAGQVTTAGGQFLFLNVDAGLTVGTVQVSAGSISLPSQTGVVTNGGEIDLGVAEFAATTSLALTLNAPVNANNFASGAATTVLGPSPALVQLASTSGDITQNSAGIIVAGRLQVEAISSGGPANNVALTAANRIGADDVGGIATTPGIVAGGALGSFTLRDHNAGITVDTLVCGCSGGIQTLGGDITLVTTGAGDITVNQPLGSGAGINIAVAPGAAFTNNATAGLPLFFGGISAAGLDTTFSGGNVAILADTINLVGTGASPGSINTVSSGGVAGAVLLGPATPTRNVTLGGSLSGTLSLAQADIDTITAGSLQIGYRNPDGTTTGSFTGTIDVAGPFATSSGIDDGSGNSILLLVTGGGVTQTGGALSAAGLFSGLSLGVLAGDTVSMQQANQVARALAAYVDGVGKGFGFNNTNQALLVGALSASQLGVSLDGNGVPTVAVMTGAASNPLSGITTNNGNIVLQTTTSGDITITRPVNANNGLTALGASPGQIGISSAGEIIEDLGGRLIGAAAELLAADSIIANNNNKLGSGNSGGLATGRGLIAGSMTSSDPLAGFLFVNFNAGLEVGTLQVSAGSINLPSQTGVVTNGAAIGLVVDQPVFGPGVGLKLSQQVNANGGSTTLGSSPGSVELVAAEFAGDITQTSTGIVVASQLLAGADSGSVTLTAGNRIGVLDSGGVATTAGVVSGYAFNNFSFVNANAGIDVGLTCGCVSGIATDNGDINLATIGAGAVTINQPLTAGNGINIAVAQGYGFTNNSTGGVISPPGIFAVAGLDTSFSGGSVVILADQISLANGTINTVDTCGCGAVVGGAVVLAPATPTKGIVIGGSDPSTLNLAQADIDTITTGVLQLGYKADGTGTSAYTGTINPGTVAISTDNVTALLLVTGGKVSQGASGAITYTGSSPLQLGVLAGDTVSLLGSNAVPLLAGYVDGAGKSFTFQNTNSDLAVGALGSQSQQRALTIDSTTGLPTPSVAGGAAPNPLIGIVTSAGGNVNLATTGTTGNITINEPVHAGGQINIAVAPGSQFTNSVPAGNTDLGFVSAGLDTSSSGGSVVVLADKMSLSGGSIQTGTGADLSAYGPVVLAPATPSMDIVVGGSDPSTLTLAQGDIDTIKAGFLQLGYKADGTGTSSYTGTINPGTVAINTDNLAALLLVTGGQVTQSAPDAISYTGSNPLQLGVLAGDTVSLLGDNSVPILAGYVDGAGKSFIFQNSANPGGDLTVGAISSQYKQRALTIDGTTGLPTPSVIGGAAPNPLAGITTSNGDVSLSVLGSGNLTLAQPINVGTGAVVLNSVGTVSEVTGGTITAQTLTGSSVGGAALVGNNVVGNIGASGWSDGGAAGSTGFVFHSTQNLTVGGTISSISGPISLTTPGALDLRGDLSTASSTVTLGAGGIAQELGTITAATLTGSVTLDARLTDLNQVATLGSFFGTNGTTGTTFTFVNGKTLTVSGPVRAASIILTTQSADQADLNLTGALTGGSVVLTAAGGITEDASTGAINSTNLIGIAQFGTGGTISLPSTSNSVTNVTLTSLSGGGTLGGGAITLANSGDINIHDFGAALQHGIATTGSVSLQTGLSGMIAEDGTIIADTLTGSFAGATLTNANQIAKLGAITNTSNPFSLTDASALTVTGALTSSGNVTLTTIGTNNDLGLNADILANRQTVTLNISGGIFEDTGTIVANTLTGSAGNGVNLPNANQVVNFGSFTSTTSTITFADARSLLAFGLNAGVITLSTTGARSFLGIIGGLTASNSVVLTSSGTVLETGGGAISTPNLSGSSVGGADLSRVNQVTGTFQFTNTASGSLNFTNAGGFQTTGTVSSPGEVTLTVNNSGSPLTLGADVTTGGTVTLTSADRISQQAGIITAQTLTGSSSGGADLRQANKFAILDAFSNTSGELLITDAQSLLTVNTIAAGTGNTTLTTTGAGSNLILGGDFTASVGIVTLNSAGTITQLGGGGIINASRVTGSSAGDAVLASNNQVDILGGFASGGLLRFTDAKPLMTFGTLSAAGNLTITTIGAGSDLSLAGNVTAGTAIVTLISGGAISQDGGVITAATLTGSSAGNATFGQSGNNIAALDAFTTTTGGAAGDFTLVDAQTSNLSITGAINAGAGTIALTTSAAGITEASGGVIDPGALAITSAGPVSLGNANTVDTLAASITGSGAGFLFNNTANPLTVGSVSGVTGITTSNGSVTLSVVGSGGLTVNNAINAGTGSVTVASVGNLALGSGGTVSGGAITLATNGNFTNSAGASALSAGAGQRWLVYSTNPANDNDGGLTPGFIQYAANYNVSTQTGTTPAAGGNGLLYSTAPQVTLTSVTKTYDGTATVPTSASAYALGGAINGDTLLLNTSGVSGAYQSQNAGTSIPVALDGLTLSATHGAIPVFGYNLANPGGGNIGIINPAALTITASSQGKTYGQTASLGTTAFTTTGTLFNNDNVTGVTLASNGAPAAATVAAYAITASDAVGNGLSNYTISYVSGRLAVNPAALTITASDQAKSYGQTASLGTTAFSTAGLVNSDAVTGVTLASAGAPGTATVAGSPYTISASNAVGSGLSNYTISYVGGLLTVNPAALTITASDQAKTYGQAASLGTTAFTTSTLFNNDAVTGVTLASGGAPATATVAGSPYAISASNAVGSGLSNYTVSYTSGLLTVNPAALTITVTNQAKTYGQMASLGTTAFSTAGLVNSDSVTGVTLASSGATASATVAGSPYAISASNAVGNGVSNYTISYVSGQLTVNPAALTITASDQAKTYGQTASLGTTAFTSTGTLFNNDAVTGVTLASAGAPGTATVAGSAYAISASNAVGSGLSNYTISYVSGQLTVNRAMLTITASDQAKTYGQTASLGTTAFTTSTLFNNDSVTGVTLASSGATASAAVAGSPYTISASNAVGSGLSNYTISYASGLLTVNPAALTITASNQAKTYGQVAALGTTAFSATGTLFNNDSVTGVTLASSGATASAAVAGSPYTISASNAVGSGLSNYTISYASGLLTVNPAALTITASNQAKTYGQVAALGTTAFSATGTLFNNDAVTGVTLASNGASASAMVAGSPYAISASNAVGSGLSNYTISYVGGLLTVNPAVLNAGLTGTVSKVFDGTTVATLVPANYVLGGVIGSDAVALNNPTSGTYASANTGTGIGVSVVGLALTGAAAGNYVLLNPAASANIGVITAPPAPPNPPDFTGELPPSTQPQPVADDEMPIVQPSLYQPGEPLYVIGGN